MFQYAARVLLVCFSLYSATAFADKQLLKKPEVQAFIKKMVQTHHFSKAQLTKIFTAVQLRQQVIQHMKQPLEKEPWHTYQVLFVNEWRIKHGVAFWNKYDAALKRAEKQYGVPASIIVATIGIETKYGQRTGDFRVMDSLSSIAFGDTPRAKYFRKELEEFLLLTREQHLDPFKIMGSYAGAIGQPQFMPSSYRAYAVNFSKKGRIDLMHNEIDVIGSIANYYNKHGWKPKEPIAIQANLNRDTYEAFLKKKNASQAYSFAELKKYNIVPVKPPKHVDLPVKLIELPSEYSTEYWLAFHNFGVIKRYNASDLYAMAVHHLSNDIKELRDRYNNG